MTTRWAAGVAVVAGAALLALAGCGDDDGGVDGGVDGGGAAAGASADTPVLAEVRACLDEAGFDVEEDSVLPEETRDTLGIEDQLTVLGSDELTGIGSLTWYTDGETATEAHEASAAVRTEDVAREVVGTVAWDYAGTDDAVAAIRGCL